MVINCGRVTLLKNMFTGLFHLHYTVVLLFLLLYVVKTTLLVTDKTTLLAKITRFTRIPEMILSFLFLATGITMLVLLPERNPLIWIKIGLVLASIPLAIYGFKKQHKIYAVTSVLFLISAFGIAEISKKAVKKPLPTGLPTQVDQPGFDSKKLGIAVFNSYCTSCHGADGKLKLAGAKDLTVSTLTPDQVKSLLENGKNAMPKFKSVLSPEELDAVIQYSLELRGR